MRLVDDVNLDDGNLLVDRVADERHVNHLEINSHFRQRLQSKQTIKSVVDRPHPCANRTFPKSSSRRYSVASTDQAEVPSTGCTLARKHSVAWNGSVIRSVLENDSGKVGTK